MSLRLFLALLTLSLIAACSPHEKTKWREVVKFADGRLIEVDRGIEWSIYRTIGGPKIHMMQATTLEIVRGTPSPIPMWNGQSEVLILLDYDPALDEYFLVTRPNNCMRWKSAGAPQPPYFEYRLRNGNWIATPLDAGLIGKDANMFAFPLGGMRAPE